MMSKCGVCGCGGGSGGAWRVRGEVRVVVVSVVLTVKMLWCAAQTTGTTTTTTSSTSTTATSSTATSSTTSHQHHHHHQQEHHRELTNDVLSRYPGQDDYISPTRSVWATEGGVADLPCNLTSPLSADPALLVLWYKDGISKPIYSYDMRNSPASHWRNPSHFDNRANFHTASLRLQRVHAGDEGTYRCRVDFRTNPTLTYTTNLTVIVPPRRLEIYTDLGVVARSVVGPFTEGDTLRLTCRARGGSPPPRVTWWEGPTLLDLTSEVREVQEVSNLLVVPELSRKDLRRPFTCQAANSNFTGPLLATVTLDMHFPPMWVRLLSSRDALSAGWPYSVVCQTAGARPPAHVTWHLGKTKLTTHTEKTTDDGNVTSSELRWTPSAEDAGKVLSCRAHSPALPSAPPLVDEWPLDIFYVPVALLQPGRSVNLSNIEEGDDVYFECSIEANPRVFKINWLHEGEELHHNVSAGVIISNQSLVLQRVAKTASGNYYCVASNIQGEGQSNPVRLKVKYTPTCRNTKMTYHGAARYEQVNIPCDLDAYPTPLSFRWTFNNSGESVDISPAHILVEGWRSTVSYTPNTELDYGTLLCWGINSVGLQRHPCVFHVFPAGHPDPVHNCSMYNLSVTVVNLRCVAGFDGGLPQTFILELYEVGADHPLVNVSSSVPMFSVGGLPGGLTLTARVYSFNSKGNADVLTFQVYTIKDQDQAEKRIAAVKPSPPPEKHQQEDRLIEPIIAVVVGVLGSLLVVLAVVCALVRIHYGRRGRACGRAGLKNPVGSEEETRISPSILKDLPPPSASSGAESWVVGSVTTISSASMPTTYTTLPQASHLTTPPNYQPCGTEDLQYNELVLSGAVSTSTLHQHHDSTPHSPTPLHHHHHHHHHDPTTRSPTPSHHHHNDSTSLHSPTHSHHAVIEDTHGHSHYAPPHHPHPSYTHPLAAVAATTPAYTVHTPTPPLLSGRQQAGQPSHPLWSPSTASIGRRHSLRRDFHPCDPDVTAPLIASQKESSV